MQPNGAARTEINIVDYSQIINTSLSGVTNMLGLTERGLVNTPKLVGTWEQFQQDFGGLVSYSDFPLYCKRALERGAALMVSRAAKFSDLTDPTTISGVKAYVTQTQSTASAAGATTTATMLTDANGTVSVIAIIPGAPNVTLADAVAVTAAATLTDNVALIEAAIDAGTSTHGFSSTATVAALAITAPASYGAFSNRITIRITSTTGITWDSFVYTMTGGVDATVNTGTVTVTALAIGTAYNGGTVTVGYPASNRPHYFDITIALPGSVLATETYYDIPQAGNTDAFDTAILAMVQASSIISAFTANDNFVLQPHVYTLASGTNTSALTTADYIGDATGLTNLHSFDNDGTATKVAIPDVVDPVLDIALVAWADQRKDCMAIIRTPVGLQPSVNIDYRNGSGVYSHTPIDSWRAIMSTGGLLVLDPRTNTKRNISEIGDLIGAIASKDNSQGQWFSFSGSKRGLVSNAYGVVINVGTPAQVANANLYDTNGINPVIQNSAKQILFWGNSTLWRTRTSFLAKAEVAELMVFLYRFLSSVIPSETFEPNDVDTWKTIYRKVKAGMDDLQGRRAIWRWDYQGDQDIVDVSQAVVNSSANIDAGQYKFKLFVSPKVAMKYIEVTVAVTNSGIDFTEL